MYRVHLFTDCSARGNQHASCKASWGVIAAIQKEYPNGARWAGIVSSTKIKYKGALKLVRPTNVRGEGMAILKALEIARDSNQAVLIHTDSKLWIDMIQKYMPSWQTRQIAWDEKENSDLTEAIWQLNSIVNADYQHVPAWHHFKQPIDELSKYYWLGNRAAEEAAEEVLKL